MGKHHKHKGRRKFIKQSGCAAMASTSLFSTLINMRAAGAAAMNNSAVTSSNDYKALVCIFLGGGNDSYNMLIPTSTGEYADYTTIRKEIALNNGDLLGLNSLNTGSRTFGLHPSMPNLRNLYNAGDAAFVANVGTLIEPMTVSEFWSESKRAPLGLLSHSDQTQQWMTALPHERSGIGWGGRIADMINSVNSNELSMNISMGGTNIFQTGVENTAYSLNGYAAHNGEDSPLSGIEFYNMYPDWDVARLRTESVDNLLDRTYADIYENTYANITRDARDGWLAYQDALDNVQLNTSFDPIYEDYVEGTRSLGWVAKMIAARETLGYKRQTFFINYDGWDHHDEVLNAQVQQLREVDHGIGQFQAAMDELGTKDCVVAFVISDFARTLGSNGNGTDHAWGGNVMAIGGPVQGQKIYGQYPTSLNPNKNEYDLGGGIIVPTTPSDLYFAQLAEWFGVPNSELATIFPNIGNFSGYQHDINFLNL